MGLLKFFFKIRTSREGGGRHYRRSRPPPYRFLF